MKTKSLFKIFFFKTSILFCFGWDPVHLHVFIYIYIQSLWSHTFQNFMHYIDTGLFESWQPFPRGTSLRQQLLFQFFWGALGSELRCCEIIYPIYIYYKALLCVKIGTVEYQEHVQCALFLLTNAVLDWLWGSNDWSMCDRNVIVMKHISF